MTLRSQNLRIGEPCNESCQNMAGDERRRFCGSCTKHVHNLSEMTETDARNLLRDTPGICVRYRHAADGTIKFADPSQSRPGRSEQLRRQRGGAARLSIVASTLLAAGLLAACDGSSASHADLPTSTETTERAGRTIAPAGNDVGATAQVQVVDDVELQVEMGVVAPSDPSEGFVTMGAPMPIYDEGQIPEDNKPPKVEPEGAGGTAPDPDVGQ